VSPATTTTYTLISTPASGPSLQATSTVRVFPDLEGWRALYFTPEELGNPALEATLWGDDADPDHDGLLNRHELKLQGNPLIASPGLLPRGEIISVSNAFYVAFTYHVSVVPEDCAFAVERTSSLFDWTLMPVNSVLETARDDYPPEGTTQITVRLSNPLPDDAAQRFYRGVILNTSAP